MLVKHAMPAVEPTVTAAEWRLGDEGREGAKRLVPRLKELDPVAVVASVEPKAWETAAIVAQRLDLPCEAAAGLHEHDRRGVAFEGSQAQFQANVRALFDRPDELVYGNERARQAERRFVGAVAGAIERWSDAAHWTDAVRRRQVASRSLVVVAHGTVISLLVAAWCGVEPFPLWQRLGLPSYAVVSLSDRRLLDVVETAVVDTVVETA